MSFEMANALDPNEIIAATQRALIDAIIKLVADTQKTYPGVPGLTWDQLNFLLMRYREKPPTIHFQDEPQ